MLVAEQAESVPDTAEKACDNRMVLPDEHVVGIDSEGLGAACAMSVPEIASTRVGQPRRAIRVSNGHRGAEVTWFVRGCLNWSWHTLGQCQGIENHKHRSTAHLDCLPFFARRNCHLTAENEHQSHTLQRV